MHKTGQTTVTMGPSEVTLTLDDVRAFGARAPRRKPGRVNEVVLDEFVVERRLGEGALGVVYLVRSRTTDSLFAVKLLKSVGEEHRRLLLDELSAWISLPEHPNLTTCRFMRTIGSYVAIFADYLEGGSLAEWILASKPLSLEQELDVAIQSAWGLHVLHEAGFVHHDIKGVPTAIRCAGCRGHSRAGGRRCLSFHYEGLSMGFRARPAFSRLARTTPIAIRTKANALITTRAPMQR